MRSAEAECLTILRFAGSSGGKCLGYAKPLDFIDPSSSGIERKHLPSIGPAVTPRALNVLAQAYRDFTAKRRGALWVSHIEIALDGPETMA